MRVRRRRSCVGGRSNAPTSSIRLDHRKASIGRTQRQRQPPSTRIRASRAKVAGLHETSARRARRDAASAAACARAPARGGSTTSASKRASSAPASGARCRSRRSVVTRAREPGAPGRLLQRREHGRIALERMHRAPGRGERQAERAAAGEQVGDAPGVPDRLVDRAPDRGLGRLARLQERAGRQLDLDLAECDRWARVAARSALPASLASGHQVMRARSCAAANAASASRSARLGVCAAMICRSMPLVLAVASSSPPGRARSRRPSSAPSGGSSATSCGTSTGQASSAITRCPVRSLKPRRTVAPWRTNANRARRRLPGCRAHQRLDPDVLESPLRERRRDLLAFPCAILRKRHVLQLAAAAGAEMGARRLGARRLLEPVDRLADQTVAASSGDAHAQAVARQRKRHEDPARHRAGPRRRRARRSPRS